MDRGRCILAKVAGTQQRRNLLPSKHFQVWKQRREIYEDRYPITVFRDDDGPLTYSVFSSIPKSKPAEVDRAEQSLQTAKGELEKAGTEWGGHRVQAIKHIDAALKELEQAEQWARQHHDIK